MANKTVNDLVAVVTPSNNDVLAVRQTGDTSDKKATIGQYTSTLAPLDSPAFTGTPTAPTAISGTSTTQLATTEFVSNSSVEAGAGLTKTANTLDVNVDDVTITIDSDQIKLKGTEPDLIVSTDVPMGTVVTSTKSNFRAGYFAMDNFSSGDYNIAIGESALQNTTSSNNNTALGAYSLQDVTTGTRNVAIGPFAGRNIQNGFSNVIIGSFTADALQSGSNNTVIGDGLTCPNTSNNIRIGTGPTLRASFNGTQWEYVNPFKEVRFNFTYSAPSNNNSISFYNEGTYTPEIFGDTVAGTRTYQLQHGHYKIINRNITVTGQVQWINNAGSSGTALISLPFACDGNQYGVFVMQNNYETIAAGNTLGGFINNLDNNITLTNMPVGGGANTNVGVDAAATVWFSVNYKLA